jgi:hypothetical protein
MTNSDTDIKKLISRWNIKNRVCPKEFDWIRIISEVRILWQW